MDINLDYEVDLGNDLDVTFGDDEIDATIVPEAEKVVANDHRELNYRDAPNQHSIGAITHLESRLEELDTDFMTNYDIDQIVRS